MRELSLSEITSVAGGNLSDDLAYSFGCAIGHLALGAYIGMATGAVTLGVAGLMLASGYGVLLQIAGGVVGAAIGLYGGAHLGIHAAGYYLHLYPSTCDAP